MLKADPEYAKYLESVANKKEEERLRKERDNGLKEKKKNDSVRKLNIYELNPSMVVPSVPVLPIGVIDNKYNRFFYSTPRN